MPFSTAAKPAERKAGTRAEEALALQQALRERWPKSRPWRKERLARPPTCSAFKSRCFPMTNWPAQRGKPSRPARRPPPRGRSAMDVEIAGYRDGRGRLFLRPRSRPRRHPRPRARPSGAGRRRARRFRRGSVVVAADLPLSRFLAIDWAQGGAIVLTEGSPTSHVAMLARARGVPMVVGLDGAAVAMAGREALVDAATRRSGAGSHGRHPRRLRREGRPRRGRERGRSAAFRLAARRSRRTGPAIAVNLNAASARRARGDRPRDLRRRWPRAHGIPVSRPGGPAGRGCAISRPIAASSPGRRGGPSPYARWTPAATSRSRA